MSNLCNYIDECKNQHGMSWLHKEKSEIITVQPLYVFERLRMVK